MHTAPLPPDATVARPASGRGLFVRLLGKLPSQCAVCHAWPAERICSACAQSHAQPVPSCPLCALQLPAGQAHAAHIGVCANCLKHPLPGIDASLARVSYQWPWQGCVDAFKFAQQTGWAQPLAQLMAQDAAIAQAIAASDLLLPMPLHPLRLAERGYNQSLLLAQALQAVATSIALPANKAMVRHDCLLRTRHTQPQSRLPIAARQRNIRNAFAVPDAHRPLLAQRKLVLVDDVMTTGASVSAAAQALKRAGAAHVTVIVFARTEKA
ncbi:MAG: phosphoribosyltransferase family protein [Brachymonas sp.]|nr:phosphoribosyltransferase family protein [Brachymonas sp.]